MGEPKVTALGHFMEQLVPGCSKEFSARLEAAVGGNIDAALKHLSQLVSAHLGDAAQPLIAAVLGSAAPALALEGLAALAEKEAARDGTPKILRWLVDPAEAAALASLLAGSPYLSAAVVRRPELLPWVLDAGRHSWSRRQLRSDLEHELPPLHREPTADWAQLRRWHERHLVRIGWADLAGWLDIAEAAANLSALADVTIDTVAEAHATALVERFGEPLQEDRIPARWCIIGLGKLGGDELNFRSDIDLLFVYSAEGQSAGGRSPGVTLHEWFSRWAERTIDTLTEVAADGMLYRVDARLRPDGRSGSLVRSLASYQQYYETRGEVWERQMLIKARPVAGAFSLGESLLHALEPFVFPRTLSDSPRKEIRRIKSRILNHLAARDAESGMTGTEDNLKLRRGGLRDIEFTVQCLQLVAGGADRKIRSANTLAAIEQMRRRRVLSEEEANALSEAYRLYRRIEHRLQMATGQRTFELPTEKDARETLARRLGFDDAETFLAVLAKKRDDVVRIYDDILGPPDAPDAVNLLLELPAGTDRAGEILSSFGFREPGAAHRNLRSLAYGHDEAHAPAGPRPAVVRLVPKLLEQLRKSPDPDRGLRNVEQVLAALGAVESFSDLLASHAGFLELLVALCSGSQSLTDSVLRDPSLIDWMLYSDVLLAERSPLEVDLVLRASVAGLDDEKAILRALHSFRKQEVLRIGLRHLLGIADDDETCRQLTAVAEATVRFVYRVSLAATFAHRGTPPQGAGMALIALGKLGSSTMNFGSDLDLVFVHAGDGETDTGTPVIELFSSAAQTIMRNLSENTPYGTLYEVDTRLRPEGRNGPLTLPLTGYRRYLHTRASTWERQALTTHRILAGPEHLHDEVERAIAEFVYAAPGGGTHRAALIEEVGEMRARMESASRTKYGERTNIKTGAGGLVDPEFVAQLGQMLYGFEDADLRGGDTLSVLRRLEGTGRLSHDVAGALIRGYRALRSVQMALRINDEHAHNVLPKEPEARDVLARSRGFDSAEQLGDWLTETMARTRQAYGAALAAYRRGRA